MDQNKIYIDYLKNFGYMKNIDRTDRVKKTQEVFTPIDACLDLINYTMQFTDNMLYDSVFDSTCGDGEWLGAVLIKRLEAGIDLHTALSNLRGIDLQQDNILLAKQRLCCGRNDLDYILDKNIVQGNTLTYHGRWDGSHPDDQESKKSTFENNLKKIIEFVDNG